MYILFSGEGATDLGVGTGAALVCEGDEFAHGPMAIIVDQIVEDRQGYSLIGDIYRRFIRRKNAPGDSASLHHAIWLGFPCPEGRLKIAQRFIAG